MKIVHVTVNSDVVTDRLVAENITNEEEAATMSAALRTYLREMGGYYFLVSDDYRLGTHWMEGVKTHG